MTLLCLSDIHGEGAGLKAVLLDAASADLIIVAGDITHFGGRAAAQEVLRPLLETGIRLVAVGGNVDREDARRYLGEAGIDLHARGEIIGGVGFMGLGGGTPSPFGTPWELPDDEASAALAAGLAPIANAPCKVLVAHAPPRDTDLDRVRSGVHGGSGAVRRFLLSTRVDLCICGHIHESGGKEIDLGGCRCVNVGAFRAGRYALISVGEGKPALTWRTI